MVHPTWSHWRLRRKLLRTCSWPCRTAAVTVAAAQRQRDLSANAAALARIRDFHFPPALSDVTRASSPLQLCLDLNKQPSDMKAVATSADAAAIARLAAAPYWNALLRTTCVAMEIDGRSCAERDAATPYATLNCRFLPGHGTAEVFRSIREAVGG